MRDGYIINPLEAEEDEIKSGSPRRIARAESGRRNNHGSLMMQPRRTGDPCTTGAVAQLVGVVVVGDGWRQRRGGRVRCGERRRLGEETAL